MKKYKDKRENDFFDLEIVQKDKKSDIVFVGDMRRSEEVTQEPVKKTKLLLWILLVIVMISSILAVLCLSVGKKQEIPINADVTESEADTQVWKGAFEDRDIYEKCRQTVVTVKQGRGSSQIIWSGLIIAQDGWIATSLDVIDQTIRGRVYVTLNDGTEYSVESITEDREMGIALLKISASGLNIADTRQESAQSGEKIISIGAEDGYYSIISGEISSMPEGYLGVSLMLGERGVGAPLFDEEGNLLGMACGKDIGENGRVCFAVPTSALNAMLLSVKQ